MAGGPVLYTQVLYRIRMSGLLAHALEQQVSLPVARLLVLVQTTSQLFQLVPGLRDHQDVLRFLPFASQRRMVDVLTDATSTFGEPLSAIGGSFVFGGVTVVLMAASYALFARRDA